MFFSHSQPFCRVIPIFSWYHMGVSEHGWYPSDYKFKKNREHDHKGDIHQITIIPKKREHDHKLSSTIKFGAFSPTLSKSPIFFHATQRHLPGGGRTLEQRLVQSGGEKWRGSLVFPEFNMYIYYILYIYIYTRNAWVLPRRCSLYIYSSQTDDIANCSNSYGKNKKGIRDY